jgi:hypothetical protein
METAVTASAAAPGTAALLIVALSRWLSDPAVLTAIASLVTALAAFARSRHHRHVPQAPHVSEERIRHHLFAQLLQLNEQFERIRRELARHQQRTTTLEQTILRCSQRRCPSRNAL